MPITKIIYERLYPIGSYLNERIGVEISLTEGQDAMQALHEAKKLTDQFHLEANEHLQSNPIAQEPETLPEEQIIRSGDVIKDLAYQINSCTNYDTLGKTFGPLMKLPKYAEVVPIYESRREQLKKLEIDTILAKTNGHV